MKHTREPWKIDEEEIRGTREPIDGWTVCNVESGPEDHGYPDDADAQRIVQCVNACAGIDPEYIVDLIVAARGATGPREAISKGWGEAKTPAYWRDQLRTALSALDGGE